MSDFESGREYNITEIFVPKSIANTTRLILFMTHLCKHLNIATQDMKYDAEFNAMFRVVQQRSTHLLVGCEHKKMILSSGVEIYYVLGPVPPPL